MSNSTHRRPVLHHPSRRRSWCCSFTTPPPSPENPCSIIANKIHKKLDSSLKPGTNSVPNSPQSSKSSLNFVGRIDPRRILSPGRVSPIDSDPTADLIQELVTESNPVLESVPKSRSESFRVKNIVENPCSSGSGSESPSSGFDVRLNLRGKRGNGLVLEMSSEVLVENSEVFKGLIEEYKKNCRNGSESSSMKMCRIEVPDVENVGIFKDTIELMFEEDVVWKLVKIGAFRAIDILEVSAGIMFAKGVASCLKYLEAIPWTEEEEDKLRRVLTMFKFDETAAQDILARLYMLNSQDSQQNLARQLVWSITTCTGVNARNELKSLVKGLLCKSSVYEKCQSQLNKQDLYDVCQCCLHSLINLFEEASDNIPHNSVPKKETGKPLIERVSGQVDNINWLLEILFDWQMGDEFVDLWIDQNELLKLHKSTSPMVRYELSRVSAILFIAIGTRKLHCRAEARAGLLEVWFRPMLLDFGWLQRCKKGLDVKALEEAMGQTLLTLPLKQQYTLFMEWFRCFSKHGTECPNLSKAFQIWWRRSFLGGSETHAIESR